MNVNELVGLEKPIYKVLNEYPNARNDDMVLYFHYVLNQWTKSETNKPFELVFVDAFRNTNDVREDFNIKPFCTIERCRRKLQAKYPELQGTNKAERDNLTKEYRAYALKNN